MRTPGEIPLITPISKSPDVALVDATTPVRPLRNGVDESKARDDRMPPPHAQNALPALLVSKNRRQSDASPDVVVSNPKDRRRAERRKRQVSVLLDTRCGHDRRQQKRRAEDDPPPHIEVDA